MIRRKENGLVLEARQDKIHIALCVTVSKRTLWIITILLFCALITLASSLSQDARKMILEFVLGTIQFLLFGERNSKS